MANEEGTDVSDRAMMPGRLRISGPPAVVRHSVAGFLGALPPAQRIGVSFDIHRGNEVSKEYLELVGLGLVALGLGVLNQHLDALADDATITGLHLSLETNEPVSVVSDGDDVQKEAAVFVYQHLRRILRANVIKQARFAELCGINAGYLAQILRAAKSPSLSVLHSIFRVLATGQHPDVPGQLTLTAADRHEIRRLFERLSGS